MSTFPQIQFSFLFSFFRILITLFFKKPINIFNKSKIDYFENFYKVDFKTISLFYAEF
ncbi:hypothetical protein LEP1GSC198_2042 [Leptospira kirschneri str. JB]|nr:hypothetical protein LEP1GSC198_2042 [Leptospira kirschneri str. JB]